MDKARLKKLKEQFDFLNMGEGSLPRELPEESISDFSKIEAGVHYDKETDDFYGKLLREKGIVKQDTIRKSGVMLSTNEKLGIPEVDKKVGKVFNSVGDALEECLKSGKTNTECIEAIKRMERTGKWDLEIDGSISSDFSKKSKKAYHDFLRDQERDTRIKDLEDFGKAVRELKEEIQDKKFTDFLEREDLTVDELIETFEDNY